jgi:4-diphosphocytidyl-2C-methyl-D-erythritol kinase
MIAHIALALFYLFCAFRMRQHWQLRLRVERLERIVASCGMDAVTVVRANPVVVVGVPVSIGIVHVDVPQ